MVGMIETDGSTSQHSRHRIAQAEILLFLGAALRTSYEDVIQGDVLKPLQRLVEELEWLERKAMHASRR